jgi:hypothetical protein
MVIRSFLEFFEENSKHMFRTMGTLLGASIGGAIEVKSGGMTCGLAALFGKKLGEARGERIGEKIADYATDALLADIPNEGGINLITKMQGNNSQGVRTTGAGKSCFVR